jgi:hypothetical protein
MPGPNGEECRLCYYGKQVPHFEKLSECRLKSPNEDGEWPRVNHSQWCGEFHSRWRCRDCKNLRGEHWLYLNCSLNGDGVVYESWCSKVQPRPETSQDQKPSDKIS